MRLAFITALFGFILLTFATINSMGKTEQTSYDINCVKIGLDAQAKSTDLCNKKGTGWWRCDSYFFDRNSCITSNTNPCGNSIIYLIGAILSFCANALYAFLWWSERKHAREIEKQVMSN